MKPPPGADPAAPPPRAWGLRRLWPSGLTLRIYLVALTPILAIIGFFIVLATTLPTPLPPQFELDLARRTAASVSAALGDIDRLNAVLADVYASASVYAPDGRLLASNATPPLPPLSGDDAATIADQVQHVGPGIPSLIAVPLASPAPRGAYLQFRLAPPRLEDAESGWRPPPDGDRPRGPHPHGPRGKGGMGRMGGMGRTPPLEPVVWMVIVGLLATALASVFLVRSLTRPLDRLTRAARLLGGGDLTARAELARKDELGTLGQAFDEMAERIAALLRSQQELLANVSHELRTPLARIRVALDIAAEGDAASAREALSEITEDLSELEHIVSEVLTTARLDLAERRAGPGISMTGQALDLGALLEKAASRFESRGPGRALELDLDLGADHVTVEGDAVLLRRAFDNLLDNARAYSDAATVVTLRARREGGNVRVTIIDHGIGISSEDLSRLGTPFFRTDRSRSRRSGGLGLGLSLTRRIIEAHGGTLEIRSEVGQGTSVEVTLAAAAG